MCYTHIYFEDWVIQLMYMYDHQLWNLITSSRGMIASSWYRFWTIEALEEAVVSNNG
jgi:hypothetical protein